MKSKIIYFFTLRSLLIFLISIHVINCLTQITLKSSFSEVLYKKFNHRHFT